MNFLSRFSLVVLPLVTAASVAHPATDWRTDRKAFESYSESPAPLAFIFRFFGPVRQTFEIDPTFLKVKLSELSGASDIDWDGPKRISERASPTGREWARKYLKREYERLGFVVSEQSYATGVNFIAEKAGTEPGKVLIVSSHYDSVGNAGADDDGSGTVSALALAQALNGLPLKNTLRIVAFDEEERGLVGSRAYVDHLSKSGKLSEVIADIQIEMTGYNSRKDGAFHVIDCDREDSTPLSSILVESIVRLNLPLKRTEACTDRSDHDAFWSANKAAVAVSQNFFGGDGNPCYHKKCDQVDQVNFDYMADITKALTWTAKELVQ